MSSQARLALAAAAVLVLLFALLWASGTGERAGIRPEPVAPPARPEVPDSSLAAVEGPADEEQVTGSSRAVVEEETPAEKLDPIVTFEGGMPFEVELRVVDGHGLSVKGAVVYAAPIGLPLNRLGRTGADGTLRAHWRGAAGILELAWCVQHRGTTSVLFREQLRSGSIHRALVRVPETVRVTRRGQGLVLRVHSVTAVRGGSASPVDLAPLVLRGESGEIGFRDPLCWGGAEKVLPARDATQVVMNLVQSDAVVFLDLDISDLLVAEETDDTPAGAIIAGVVQAPDEEPAVGVPVTVGPDDRRVSSYAETDEQGRYVLENVSPGELFLRAGGGRAGLAFERVAAGSGDRIEWSPTLDLGLVTSGRLCDGDGAPLSGWRVELSADAPDGPWHNEAHTSEDGRFSIPNCPGTPMRMEVFPGGRKRLPAAVLDGVVPDAREQEFPLDLSEGGDTSVAITVLDRDENPLKEVEVRLWHVVSGRGIRFTSEDAEGRHTLGGIPPGQYLLEIGCARLGWTELGPLYLAGAEITNELGTIHLPEPGRELGTLEIRFEPPRPWDGGELAWSAHRTGWPVVAHVLSIESATGPFRTADVERVATGQGDSILLPPADYVLRLHHPEHGTRDFPVRIDAGATTALLVKVDDEDGVTIELVEPKAPPDDQQ